MTATKTHRVQTKMADLHVPVNQVIKEMEKPVLVSIS
jgi:hypothetical protein